MRRLTGLAVVAVVLALLSACGGGQDLTMDEQLEVASALSAIALHAQGEAHALTDGDFELLDELDFGDVLRGVDRLIELYRANPDARYDDLTLRQVLQDTASTLERYEPDLAAKLDRALE